MRPRCLLLILLVIGCDASPDEKKAQGRDTVVVYAAASLAGPMRAVLDTFARRTGAVVAEEHGASLELARRITICIAFRTPSPWPTRRSFPSC
jgi:ABC-type molybdate transport system substrate-binding protein